jgi:hypothetical protein
LHDLPEPLCDRLQVAPREAAIRRKALGEDQRVAAGHGEVLVVHSEPTTDVAHGVLLGAHRHPVREGGHVAHDVGDLPVTLALFAFPDEPGVLGEPACVQEQRPAEAVTQLADAT